jgi:hypothetical protein
MKKRLLDLKKARKMLTLTQCQERKSHSPTTTRRVHECLANEIADVRFYGYRAGESERTAATDEVRYWILQMHWWRYLTDAERVQGLGNTHVY